MVLMALQSVIKLPPQDVILDFSIKHARLYTQCFVINDLGSITGLFFFPSGSVSSQEGPWNAPTARQPSNMIPGSPIASQFTMNGHTYEVSLPA
jgi:hypothetical protein